MIDNIEEVITLSKKTGYAAKLLDEKHAQLTYMDELPSMSILTDNPDDLGNSV